MDAGRHLNLYRLGRVVAVSGLVALLGGCALFRPEPPAASLAARTAPLATTAPDTLQTASETGPEREPEAGLVEGSPSGVLAPTARPYLSDIAASETPAPSASRPSPPAPASASGRSAIAAANREARADSHADAFVGGVQVFAWEPGRVYEVWTAPLRVTVLTLAPGETVTAKAAGDTVRWQIGESVSGSGAGTRSHVLIKPLQTGLETNLVLTTSQRVYMLSLKSGRADAFNAAATWDFAPDSGRTPDPAATEPAALPPVDVEAVRPDGPLDARYRIQTRGRAPRWTPTAVFNDGVRTFIALAAETVIDEAPALFVKVGEESQLINYRQDGNLLIVDRVFDEAELRLGDLRPSIVTLRRLEGAPR